ncbi:GNAT family N-acetyltransferase [Amorphoplanes nipponensis]|uniref:N-acetyltransferase n=1 Tax=Actinoplanes nipponensis TaxID=135950 RepID=A0A919JEP2_9ACTN|nr:GNAT family N-acetyltransferase [Actinoplanes nipponensis]GIE49318.1 N-acetyltransferase [Actinoplanes nipponensis]
MLRIVPLTDERAAHAIDRTVAELDAPDIPFDTLEGYRARLRYPWPSQELEQYLAVRDGAPVGHLELGLPQLDNRDNVNMLLCVLPAERRAGAGRAMLTFAIERARALGRRHLIGASAGGPASSPSGPSGGGGPAGPGGPVSDGAAFAAAVGAVPGLVELRSRLDVTAAAPADVPPPPGYRIVRWTGTPPGEYLDDVGYLDSRLNLDAPVGDLAWEPTRVDAARVRATEEMLRARGCVTFHTGAVDEAGGRLVAWTVISGRAGHARHAWQGITMVDPAHRGRRLGLTIKIQNLAYARAGRPGLREIDTFNAAQNDHMLRINREVGFRPVDRWIQWQLTD